MDAQPSSEYLDNITKHLFRVFGIGNMNCKEKKNMNGFNVYQETAVSTQNRGRLIVMLYEGAVKFLRQAMGDIKQEDMAAKGRHIAKAQDILFELNTVLNMEKGGEIAQNLRSLYNFMQRHLTEANIQKDPRMIQEVIDLLEELNQSWRAISH